MAHKSHQSWIKLRNFNFLWLATDSTWHSFYFLWFWCDVLNQINFLIPWCFPKKWFFYYRFFYCSFELLRALSEERRRWWRGEGFLIIWLGWVKGDSLEEDRFWIFLIFSRVYPGVPDNFVRYSLLVGWVDGDSLEEYRF